MPEERGFADAGVVAIITCVVGKPVFGGAEDGDLEAFAHASGCFAYYDLLVVTIMTGDHDDGFKFEAMKFGAKAFEPGAEVIIFPALFAFNFDCGGLVETAHATIKRWMYNASAYLLGCAHTKGVGFERVEAKGIVLAVPFDCAEGHKTHGECVQGCAKFFGEHEFPLGVAFL